VYIRVNKTNSIFIFQKKGILNSILSKNMEIFAQAR